MGKAQRTKGATYEREVAHVFADALGIEVKRNIGQARDGGNDLDVGPLVVECKRRKTLTTIESWIEQADAAHMARYERVAADDPDVTLYSLVVARSDGGDSLAILRLDDFLRLAKPAISFALANPALAHALAGAK